MKILFKNANVIDTKKQRIIKADVLVINEKIVEVRKNIKFKSAKVINLKGKWICPGFIDGHIHIESSKLLPNELAKVLIKHGTSAIVVDPHEIANVSGTRGIDFMLEASKDIPLDVYFTIPSCVPATMYDESYEVLPANKLERFVDLPCVVGLAEVMNFVGVVNKDYLVLEKIKLFKKNGKVIDGHAPGLKGQQLKQYVKQGIQSDHECSTYKEALEKVKLGQWIMIRNGSATKNLVDLLPLFDKWSHKCMIVTDDKEPLDLLTTGHLDESIKIVLKHNKSLLKAISMVTYNPAKYFRIKDMGLIKPKYKANFIIFDDLNSLKISQVYHHGKCVYDARKNITIKNKKVDRIKYHRIYNSINIGPLKEDDFNLKITGMHKTNIIDVIPQQAITKKIIRTLNFNKNNGIDVKKDILKIVVLERHRKTNHLGIAYVHGFGFKNGALASTVSHDSHNIIAIGSSNKNILLAINKVKEINGGQVVVKDHKVIADLPLPIGGLMSDKDINTVIKQNKKINLCLKQLGVNKKLSPFMNMGFISLSVIPELKITTYGLIDSKTFKIIKLLAD